ncbi:hypothetical protein CBF34_00885 [Vagococcus penaei]|uniref:Uncharacterized protein n=1 Tax=Vagococcus penaei TaxID=633807 RepID=A0A1Q2D8C4_9ENTE|nr:hypothetical protein [Vagococcus penaei]AQP54617.1 hypothetical protein BW732_10655 [Vagococcus penaei]RSU06670.1 hypothetical protein CBF34_00885 [Vagococcus penaei]
MDRLKQLPDKLHRRYMIVLITYLLILIVSAIVFNINIMFCLLIALGILMDIYFIPKATTGKKKWIIWDIFFYSLTLLAIIYLNTK